MYFTTSVYCLNKIENGSSCLSKYLSFIGCAKKHTYIHNKSYKIECDSGNDIKMTYLLTIL